MKRTNVSNHKNIVQDIVHGPEKIVEYMAKWVFSYEIFNSVYQVKQNNSETLSTKYVHVCTIYSYMWTILLPTH